MEKKHMIKLVADYLWKSDIGNEYGFKKFAEEDAANIIDIIEKNGMKPPCVEGDKCQFLLHKFIDPSFYYWDEDFDKKYKNEYDDFVKRRKKVKTC